MPETVYQALYGRGSLDLAVDPAVSLRSGPTGRRPRRRKERRTRRFPDMGMIRDRPAEVIGRLVPGHWEGDLAGLDHEATLEHSVECLYRPERHDSRCRLGVPASAGAQAKQSAARMKYASDGGPRAGGLHRVDAEEGHSVVVPLASFALSKDRHLFAALASQVRRWADLFPHNSASTRTVASNKLPTMTFMTRGSSVAAKATNERAKTVKTTALAITSPVVATLGLTAGLTTIRITSLPD